MDQVRQRSQELLEAARYAAEEAAGWELLRQMDEEEKRAEDQRVHDFLYNGSDVEEDDGEGHDTDEDDFEWLDPVIMDTEVTERNMTPLPMTSLMANRNNNSNRGTSDTINGWIIDNKDKFNVDYRTLFVDQHKIARGKQKMAEEEKRKRAETVDDINYFGFDSKWTKALVSKEIHGREYSVGGKEDLYVLVSASKDAPEGKYFSNFTPKVNPNDDVRKKARIVADSFNTRMEELGVDTNNIQCLAVDSTNLNTGWENGIITILEHSWDHNVVWIVCSLHIAELPLRKLIQKLDGKSLSGEKWSGPLGKLLNDVNKLPLNPNFTPITEFEMPEIPPDVLSGMSEDQKYLAKIIDILVTGVIPDQFERYEIGTLNLARWLTCASRICRLYISDLSGLGLEQKDLDTLLILVRFIIGGYFPFWMRLKSSPSWLEAPRHYIFFLERFRMMDQKAQDTARSTVQHGAWCLHPENLLQTMLSSEDRDERQFAIKKILQIRAKSGNPAMGNKTVRHRRTPKINFGASSIMDVIDWTKAKHEPVLTYDISSGIVFSDLNLDFRCAISNFYF